MLDLAQPLPYSLRTPSLLLPSHGDAPCDPGPGALFGCLAEQSPFTGYEPNDLIQVNYCGGNAHIVAQKTEAELRLIIILLKILLLPLWNRKSMMRK